MPSVDTSSVDRQSKAAPPHAGTDNSRYLTTSVQRAVSLLKAFSIEKPTYSLVELAHATGLNVSTAHRLLTTLEAEGLLERDPDNGHFRLAIKVFELGGVVLHGMELNVVGTPILARLATETEDTAYFTVLSGDGVLCVARIEGVRHSRSQYLAVGRRLPLHAGAGSKVLLAHMPPEQARTLLAKCSFTPYTEHTITDPDRLLAELVTVKKQGYALSIEEITDGISAIAAPIRGHDGNIVGAVSLSGAAERYRGPHLSAFVERVTGAATHVSLRLGYVPTLTI